MTDVIIKVNNLSKCYHIYDTPRDRLNQFFLPRLQRFIRRQPQKYFREFWALKDVSFEIKKGETVGIIGANGSGKSTLLQMIAGTLTPSQGDIKIKGRVAALLELGSGFNPEFTGRENAFLNGTILGLSHEEVSQRFAEIEAFADIGDFIDQPVKTYSSGMILRLAFSVSVNVQPDILIVDEALAVGDAAFQFKCMERLNELTNSGTTLLFVSHDLNMLKMFCNHVLFLKNGSVHASGSAEDVTNIYIMNLRNDQSRQAKSNSQIMQKTSLRDGFAYGTSQGKIANAEFISGGKLNHVVKGQQIAFWIELEFDDSIKCPSVTVLVENTKKIPIGGQHFLINKVEQLNGSYKSHLECTFTANFASGRYFISIRLDDYLTEQNFYVIDKQAALLSFEVENLANGVRGIVDLEIKFKHKEASFCE